MAPKSIYRRAGAQHFQLVHRSQRDPLINDPEASQKVLKEVGIKNQDRKAGRTRAELEQNLPPSAHPQSALETDASAYGILYNDAYDYTQHLRPIGAAGGDSVLLTAAAPKQSQPTPSSSKGKGKESVGGVTFELPADVLPSKTELPLSSAYNAQSSLQAELQGLQPDMDPHLRQVLEALDDDDFVETADDEDDLFNELVKEGEGPAQQDWEFREWGLDDEGNPEWIEEFDEGEEDLGSDEEEEETLGNWGAVRQALKQQPEVQGARSFDSGSESENDEDYELYGSEAADTISGLPQLSVLGGKKRRGKAPTDATGWSMSSSSMSRNKGLSTLDEQYDQIEALYEEEDEDEDEDYSGSDPGEEESIPNLVTRTEFLSEIDTFLADFETVGSRHVRRMEGETNADKLGNFRNAFVPDEEEQGLTRQRIIEEHSILKLEKEREPLPMPAIVGMGREGWDAETIISTYSNLENHPRMIRSRRVPKVAEEPSQLRINAATGLPIDQENIPEESEYIGDESEEEDDDDDENNPLYEERAKKETVTRPRNESKEDKKARKAAVKEERQSRRIEKKTHKTIFASERKRQGKAADGKVANGMAADLSLARSSGVHSLA